MAWAAAKLVFGAVAAGVAVGCPSDEAICVVPAAFDGAVPPATDVIACGEAPVDGGSG